MTVELWQISQPLPEETRFGALSLPLGSVVGNANQGIRLPPPTMVNLGSKSWRDTTGWATAGSQA